MNTKEVSLLMQAIAPVIHDQIEQGVKEALSSPGEFADSVVKAILEKLPPPDRGAPGERGERGEPGLNGKDAHVDQAAIAALVLRELPIPKDGKDGERGPPGIAGAKGDKGDPGEKGEPGTKGADGLRGEKGDPGLDGRSVELSDVLPRLQEQVRGFMKEIPIPRDGRDGDIPTYEFCAELTRCLNGESSPSP